MSVSDIYESVRYEGLWRFDFFENVRVFFGAQRRTINGETLQGIRKRHEGNVVPCCCMICREPT